MGDATALGELGITVFDQWNLPKDWKTKYGNLRILGTASGGVLSHVLEPVKQDEAKPWVMKVEKKANLPNPSQESTILPQLRAWLKADGKREDLVPELLESGSLDDQRRFWRETKARGENILKGEVVGFEPKERVLKGKQEQWPAIVEQLMDLYETTWKRDCIPDDKKFPLDIFVDKATGEITVIDWDFLHKRDEEIGRLSREKPLTFEENWRGQVKTLGIMGLVVTGGFPDSSLAKGLIEKKGLLDGVNPAIQIMSRLMMGVGYQGELTPTQIKQMAKLTHKSMVEEDNKVFNELLQSTEMQTLLFALPQEFMTAILFNRAKMGGKAEEMGSLITKLKQKLEPKNQ